MFAFWLLVLTIMLCYIAAMSVECSPIDQGFTPVKCFDGRRPHPVREKVPVMTIRMLIGLLRLVVDRYRDCRLICLL